MTATRRETTALLMAALASGLSLVSAGLLSWLADGTATIKPMAVLWVATTLLPAALTIVAGVALVHGERNAAKTILGIAAWLALPTIAPAACALLARLYIETDEQMV